eukprot:TRINITY_DN1489_c0_g1_i2.p1 TRINITY_DN1489_c0_g1~~TRINITY_DN1489_c0_g1_i2.p1  ORF type:complete len:174 (+),score=56.46 TRINITY_DN1489_c0_g1_i2:340-861(+)
MQALEAIEKRKRAGSKSRSRSSSSSGSSSSSSKSKKSKKSKKNKKDKDDVVTIVEDATSKPEAKPLGPSTASIIAEKMEEQAIELAKLSVKELKEQITQSGLSFAGATEKEELVRLLTKYRAQKMAAASTGNFVPSKMWQRVPDGVAVPAGLEVKFDMEKGCNYARIPPESKT